MNTYFTPLLDGELKTPVWSDWNFPSSTTVLYEICVSALPGSIVVEMGICVDLSFFLVWLNFTCNVANDFGKYLRTSLDANPDRDWKNPLSMEYIHMCYTGMNDSACRYSISYGKYDV